MLNNIIVRNINIIYIKLATNNSFTLAKLVFILWLFIQTLRNSFFIFFTSSSIWSISLAHPLSTIVQFH